MQSVMTRFNRKSDTATPKRLTRRFGEDANRNTQLDSVESSESDSRLQKFGKGLGVAVIEFVYLVVFILLTLLVMNVALNICVGMVQSAIDASTTSTVADALVTMSAVSGGIAAGVFVLAGQLYAKTRKRVSEFAHRAVS